MKKTVSLLLFLSVLIPALPAQDRKIYVRGFDPDILELRAKTDPVYDNNQKPSSMVSVFLPSKDSLVFKGNILKSIVGGPGEWILYIPASTEWIEVAAEGCEPLHFDFPEEKPLLSAYGYTLNLGILMTNPLRTLILPTFTYNQSQYSYGLMLGICKRNGFYVRAKSDFSFGLDPVLACDGQGRVNGVQSWFTGESQKSRWAVTGGYLRKLTDALYVYAGGGYGDRILAWKMYADGDYEWARVTDNSFTGYEVELGMVYRTGVFALSAGVQTNQFKYYEANVGIGVMF